MTLRRDSATESGQDGAVSYRSDLAQVHHLHHDDVAEAAAQELIARLHERSISEGLIVDLGCGSGVTAKALNQAGYDVLGIDISPDMIEIARRTAPESTFQCASLFDVEIPTCVAVTAIGESVNYAFDERASFNAIAELAESVFEALEPGGLAMLDSAGPGRAEPGSVTDSRFNHEDWMVLVRTTGSQDGLELTREITIFRREQDDVWRRSDEEHRLRLYSPEVVTERLLHAGFDVLVLSGYDDLTFPTGWAGFLGHKRRR